MALIQNLHGAATVGDTGLDDTLDAVREQMRRFAEDTVVPHAHDWHLNNDYIPLNQTKGTGSNQTTIFAGTFDDGSRSHGLAGLTAENASGINVVDVGEAEDKDEHIWRVKWYAGLALFSEKGLSCADGITN